MNLIHEPNSSPIEGENLLHGQRCDEPVDQKKVIEVFDSMMTPAKPSEMDYHDLIDLIGDHGPETVLARLQEAAGAGKKRRQVLPFLHGCFARRKADVKASVPADEDNWR